MYLHMHTHRKKQKQKLKPELEAYNDRFTICFFLCDLSEGQIHFKSNVMPDAERLLNIGW